MTEKESPRPLDLLGGLATQDVEIAPGLRHIEIFTLKGLLTVLWHGNPSAERVVLMFGGAMGGLLGPANGLYQDLATTFAAQGIGVLRVGYRRPGDLDSCTIDVSAAADLAWRGGARKFVVVGHSFGGAVAVRVGISIPQAVMGVVTLASPSCSTPSATATIPNAVVGVVTLATQSAGCETAANLRGRPLLLLHGDRDELLPLAVSETVRDLAGSGELVVLKGTGHLMTEAAEELRTRLGAWIPEALA